jgi:hypothetical protein
VAFAQNFTFVTRNRRDFDRITGLKVENWFESATSGKAGGLTEVERLKAAWPFGR